MFNLFKRSQRKQEEIEEAIVSPIEGKDNTPKTVPCIITTVSLTNGSVVALVDHEDASLHPKTYIRYSGSWHYFNGDPRFITHGRISDWVGIITQKELETNYQDILKQ